MKQFGITIPVGLGDAIFISSVLNSVKHQFDKITVNIRWDYAGKYKNNKSGYGSFCIDILKLLLTDPKFVIDDKSVNPPFMTMKDLWRRRMPPVLPRYIKQLTTDERYIDGDYLVVTTKIRELDRALYKKAKPLLMNRLNELSSKYKIVILGEREVEMNDEYKIHGAKRIYCMYDEIISSVKDNIVDLSIPKLGITVPSIDNIKKDCTIMKHAGCVFTLGCGGNNVLGLAVAKRLISFRKDMYNFIDHVSSQSDDVHDTYDDKAYAKFLQELK